MSFREFGEMSLADFIERERAPDNLWIFLHIPKTAGSSFGKELARLRPPYRNIHVDYSDNSVPHWVKLDKSVELFVQDFKSKAYKSCSGHIRMAHVQRIKAAEPGARAVTFLRNPVERIVSDFRYTRTQTHPSYKEYIEKYPTIVDYINDEKEQNKMSKFLGDSDSADINVVMKNVNKMMVFVGLVEMYPMSFNIISKLFGHNKMPKLHQNRTAPTENNIVVVDAQLKRKIVERNANDIQLYRRVKKRLTSKHDEWQTLQQSKLSG
jgi:hypothetical protein